MVVIWGNSTLIARAAQMVWICKPSSGATPGGNANGTSRLATGALAATSSAAAGLAVFVDGAVAGTAAPAAGVAAGVLRQHGCWVPWAWNMAAETATETATASQRPRPLANKALLTDSNVLVCLA
jgi:hypothetical protein